MPRKDKFSSLEVDLAASIIHYDKEEMENFFDVYDQISQDGNIAIDGMFIKFVSFLRNVDLSEEDAEKRRERLISEVKMRCDHMSSSNQRDNFALWFDTVLSRNVPTELADDIFAHFVWNEYKKAIERIDQSSIPFREKLTIRPKIPKKFERGGIVSLSEIPDESAADGRRYTSGLAEVDLSIKFVRGNFVVIGARPGVGKSLVMLNMAVENAINDVKCLFISLEMTKQQIKERIINHVARTNLVEEYTDYSGHFNREGYERARKKIIESSTYKMIERNLFLYDDAPSNAESLLSKIEDEIKQNKYECIFLDYLQLIRYVQMDEWASIRALTRALKVFARSSNTVIVTGSQVSRVSTERGLTLADLFGGQSIESDTDIVIGLENPTDRRQGSMAKLNVKILKNREGKHGNFSYSIDYSDGVMTLDS